MIGLGRYIPRIAQIAAAPTSTSSSPRACTPTTTSRCTTTSRARDGAAGPEPMTELFVRDITEASRNQDQSRNPQVRHRPASPRRRAGAARSQAHRRTGVPISTHTHAATGAGSSNSGSSPRRGVDPDAGGDPGIPATAPTWTTSEELIAAGSYLGMDRFGADVYLPTPERVDTVVRMCERGHADKMVLSHDASCFIDWLPEGRSPSCCRTGTTCTSTTMYCPLRERGVPRSRSPRCWWTTPTDLRNPGWLLTWWRAWRTPRPSAPRSR